MTLHAIRPTRMQNRLPRRAKALLAMTEYAYNGTHTMKQYLTKLHYITQPTVEDKLVTDFLRAPAALYRAVVAFRNLLYSLKIIKTRRLPAYVVSVGNLTTGGTGKTPITAEIAKYLSRKSRKVAILSRGYGGRLSGSRTNIISDGVNVFYTPYLAGDEPYWMASNTEGVMVITGKNRCAAGQEAIEEHGVDTIVLDDGYQHIKLERNLNILVIDCFKKFGNGLALPAGPLREPMDGIKRADRIILVNKSPFNTGLRAECAQYGEYLGKTYGKPVHISSFKTLGIYSLKTNEPIQAHSRAQFKIYAFAGIGQPDFFFNELKQSGFEVVQTREFPDHHLYTEEDLAHIIKEAREGGAQGIITTEKDAVKLSVIIDEVFSNIEPPIEIFALKLGIDLDLDKLFEGSVDE